MNNIEITTAQRVLLAMNFLSDIIPVSTLYSPAANVYIGIGQNTPWAADNIYMTADETTFTADEIYDYASDYTYGDQLVETTVDSTDYINKIFNNLVAIKKILLSNSNLVVRRQDWSVGIVYDAYSNSLPMFTSILTSNANGTVDVTTTSTSIVGNNTTFTLDYQVGSIFQLSGDNINVPSVQKEIIQIIADNFLVVNTAITGTYIANTPQIVIDTSPNYAYNFYVRNSYDQVFVCLNNNNGSISTMMPQISLGGQLPSDAYIVTSDGYNWKYLYTIPSGLKLQYFTDEWMPVSTDNSVIDSAVDGRIDVVNIINGGSGYYANLETFSAPILNVIGDGVGANLTAEINDNGTIIGVNILSGGSGYTNASIEVITGATGNGANLVPVIGPQGGWGSNVAFELGATNIMISVDLSDLDPIPIVDAQGNYLTYRQIVLLKDPMIVVNGTKVGANGINYDMTTIAALYSNTTIGMNDTLYQSSNGSVTGATFIGTVVYFDSLTNNVHLNNTIGTLINGVQIFATKGINNPYYASYVVASNTPPLIVPFSGKITYVENREPIQRFIGQTENLRIVIEF